MKACCVLVLAFFSVTSSAEDCATRLEELSKTERLALLKPLFASGAPTGFVNETKGSYFRLEQRDGQFQISFFTSGLFDLYPIKREGQLSFCDDGHGLHVIGLGRDDEIRVDGIQVQLGGGGPKRHFSPGAVPEVLRRLHHLDERGIASDP